MAHPTLLLDTNILLHYIRGDGTGLSLDRMYNIVSPMTPRAICIVSSGEIRSLAKQAKCGTTKTFRMYTLLSLLTSVSIDSIEILEAYAELDTFSKSNGITLGKNDLWIAATAVATGYDLLTLDKDFDVFHNRFLTVVRLT